MIILMPRLLFQLRGSNSLFRFCIQIHFTCNVHSSFFILSLVGKTWSDTKYDWSCKMMVWQYIYLPGVYRPNMFRKRQRLCYFNNHVFLK